MKFLFLFLLVACGAPTSPSGTTGQTNPAASMLQNSAPAVQDNTGDSGSARLGAGALEAIGPVSDGICRAHAPPSGGRAGACTVVGPYPGELNGTTLSSDLGVEEALTACAADLSCTGVSTDWYIGASFRLVSVDAFAPDEMSYGCTLLIGSCSP